MPGPSQSAPGQLGINELRSRLAALGGLVELSGTPQPPLGPQRQLPAPPSLTDRALRLGFAAVAVESGVSLVRRVSVDLAPFLERAGATGPPAAEELVRLVHAIPTEVSLTGWHDAGIAVLDIETIGLRGSGIMPFLVGIGRFVGGSLEIDQFLLGDPDAEGALLDGVIAVIAAHPLLVTYNGRSFDVPVLQSRCLINRRHPEAMSPAVHCDLLAPVRRLFRDRLDACTLRRAEVGLLGFDRGEDVPGFEAGGRYRTWLRGGPAAALEGVVRHNQMDVCATAVLAARLVGHVNGELVQPVRPGDRYRLGVHLDRVGMKEAAEEHLAWAFGEDVAPWSRFAGHRIARRRGRDGAHAALPVWRELHRRQPGDLAAARGLAIALERSGDIAGAMAVCLEAEALLAGRSSWQRRLAVVSSRGREMEAEWARRLQRLRRRRSLPVGLLEPG